jgi:hypothetical protein
MSALPRSPLSAPRGTGARDPAPAPKPGRFAASGKSALPEGPGAGRTASGVLTACTSGRSHRSGGGRPAAHGYGGDCRTAGRAAYPLVRGHPDGINVRSRRKPSRIGERIEQGCGTQQDVGRGTSLLYTPTRHGTIISNYIPELWSYGDSNPGPLACHYRAEHPPASVPAGHRPGACTAAHAGPGRLRYFPAVRQAPSLTLLPAGCAC